MRRRVRIPPQRPARPGGHAAARAHRRARCRSRGRGRTGRRPVLRHVPGDPAAGRRYRRFDRLPARVQLAAECRGRRTEHVRCAAVLFAGISGGRFRGSSDPGGRGASPGSTLTGCTAPGRPIRGYPVPSRRAVSGWSRDTRHGAGYPRVRRLALRPADLVRGKRNVRGRSAIDTANLIASRLRLCPADAGGVCPVSVAVLGITHDILHGCRRLDRFPASSARSFPDPSVRSGRNAPTRPDLVQRLSDKE